MPINDKRIINLSVAHQAKMRQIKKMMMMGAAQRVQQSGSYLFEQFCCSFAFLHSLYSAWFCVEMLFDPVHQVGSVGIIHILDVYKAIVLEKVLIGLLTIAVHNLHAKT